MPNNEFEKWLKQTDDNTETKSKENINNSEYDMKFETGDNIENDMKFESEENIYNKENEMKFESEENIHNQENKMEFKSEDNIDEASNNKYEDTESYSNFEEYQYKEEKRMNDKKEDVDILYSQKEDNNNEFADKNYVNEQIKKNKSRFSYLKAMSLILIGTIIGSFIAPFVNNTFYTNTKNTEVESPSNNQGVTINASEEKNVENAVAQKSIPSVVGIRVRSAGQDRFTGQITEGEGIGSGVIVSEDGYILTNAHVVGTNATEINVLFNDKSNEKARIVWMDQSLDLAVIKVEKKGLQAMEIADSDKIQIGDKAIAIGNPFGLNLQSTLTSGYISGLNRSITMKNGQQMNGLIQTDASINAGNSGGALLNSKGQLIGINTARADNSDGIGFAIPSNVAKSIVDSIKEGGNFSPVTLGVVGAMDLMNYKRFYLDETIDIDKGVIIPEVVANSAADKAGMKTRDVITKINGENIESVNKLKQELVKYKVGDTVDVVVYRDGKEITLKVHFEDSNPNI